MPHQEYLSQAGRELTHRGRVSGSATWLAALLLIVLAATGAPARAAANATPLTVSAARGDWNSFAAPATGWTPVTLPDIWTRRWPGFDGVVWYRLQWSQPAPVQATGMMMDYLVLAGAVYVNGVEMERDRSLVEPLSRTWNIPRYWQLSPPLLRAGENTVLIRVSGLAAYAPGLGLVTLGPPSLVSASYEHERLVRQDLQILGLSVSATLALFFGTLWLMRRQEAAYGWFAGMTFAWLCYGLNEVVTSPWPFAGNDGWEAFNTQSFVLFVAGFVFFILRFCHLRRPRLEAGAVAISAALCLWLYAAPPTGMEAARAVSSLVASLLMQATCWFLLWRAWRGGQTDQRALAPFMFLAAIADVHDMLVFLQVLDSNMYYATMASYTLLIGMALILAARFVNSLQRIENFNSELSDQVRVARAELAETLQRQHALEVSHARMSERLHVVRDLHDGFGGTLVGSIAAVEQAGAQLSAAEQLSLLKNLRDDLRLVIDTATGAQHCEADLATQLIPVRHRLTQMLDAADIDCRWTVAGLEQLQLPATRSLDVLRIVQEALTNVLKHSGASRVDVRLEYRERQLVLDIADNGRGMNTSAAHPGAGLASMRARSQRLGATWDLQSNAAGTRLRLEVPVLENA